MKMSSIQRTQHVVLYSDPEGCIKNIVTKPTHDSGTLIDHVYTTKTLRAKSDVTDCYYSDHDFVLVNIN